MTMNKSLRVTTSVDLDASIANVWHALTDKDMIKQYFWGTEIKTDWKECSPISFSGTYEGTSYEDKGFILKFKKEAIISYSYWSSFWGTEFNPDELSIITYELTEKGTLTTLRVTQEGFKDTEARNHSLENWKEVLKNIRNLLEK